MNLALAKRAIKALDLIGAKDHILKHGIELYGRSSHVGMNVYYTQYGKANDCIFSISRHLLNDLLVEYARNTDNVTFKFE